MIEMLLTPGSIPELAMRHCVLKKYISPLFFIGAKQTKDLQIEPKKVICVDVVRQTQSAWFMQGNELVTSWFEQNLKVDFLFRLDSLQ